MKKITIIRSSFLVLLGLSLLNICCAQKDSDAQYTLVVEGFDWGAAASKAILHLAEPVSEIKASDFEVSVERSSSCIPADAPNTSGKRDVVYAYVSDAKGNRVAKGKFVTLNLEVGPYIGLDAPIQYFFSGGCNGNQWVDYKLAIEHKGSEANWNQEADRIIPLVDEFDLTGKFAFNDDITLTYASFQSEKTKEKAPLLIWLHGGGEGGTDPSIVLLANRAANYASPEIQAVFGGAHVLVPQSPTFWMQSASGDYTRGNVNDIYNKSLMGLIQEYLKNNPDVDQNRIYVGGCSNGGYMTQKLLLQHPDYFAAAFPSALAYHAEFLSEADLKTLAEQSIWYIHSKDDPVTKADATVIPTYQKLMEAGAKDVHLSMYDHVTDLYGLYGGENYHYNGHFSWIYSHRNHCEKEIDGKTISVMEWLASKKR